MEALKALSLPLGLQAPRPYALTVYFLAPPGPGTGQILGSCASSSAPGRGSSSSGSLQDMAETQIEDLDGVSQFLASQSFLAKVGGASIGADEEFQDALLSNDAKARVEDTGAGKQFEDALVSNDAKAHVGDTGAGKQVKDALVGSDAEARVDHIRASEDEEVDLAGSDAAGASVDHSRASEDADTTLGGKGDEAGEDGTVGKYAEAAVDHLKAGEAEEATLGGQNDEASAEGIESGNEAGKDLDAARKVPEIPVLGQSIEQVLRAIRYVIDEVPFKALLGGS